MSETILRSEAMRVINSRLPVTLEVVTADRRRGTGGDLITLKNWQRMSHDVPPQNRPRHYTDKPRWKKDYHRDKTKSFLMFNPANKAVHPITVHFRLIQTINGKTVING